MLLRRTESTAGFRAALETAWWLVQLRWVAVFGQCLAVLISRWLLDIRLPLWELGGAIAVTAVANVALMVYLRRRGRQLASSGRDAAKRAGRSLAVGAAAMHRITRLENVLGCSLLLDVVTLTVLLFLSGGVGNPFSCFYFANIAVCGLLLAPRWTWAVSIASVIAVCCLLASSRPLPLEEFAAESRLPFFSIRKQGSLVALTTCFLIVTYFINVLMQELRNREGRLAAAELERTKAQQHEAMATLAAGAGHELASPLSTIAVVTKELSRRLEKADVPAGVIRDVELIRSELDRCREVLQRMKSGAGESSAEEFQNVTAAALVEAVVSPLRQPQRVRVELAEAQKTSTAKLPLQNLAQAIRNLVQNALDASRPDQNVDLKLINHESRWTIIIRDEGSGMSSQTLERIGQPFFTTKSVGQGMGLGVFLSRNVISGLDGELEITSRPEGGTTVTVTLPRHRQKMF